MSVVWLINKKSLDQIENPSQRKWVEDYWDKKDKEEDEYESIYS